MRVACCLQASLLFRAGSPQDSPGTDHVFFLPLRAWSSVNITGVAASTDDIPKKKVANIFRPPSPDVLAYLDFSVSTTGILAGVKVGPGVIALICFRL